MKFTDLFACLGGFNRALANHGHDCVLVSEVNPALIDLYELNHSIRPKSDVTKVTVEDIPEHDMLCPEFPCQTFLKVEAQLWREDPSSGTLFALYV